jgi:hypothetical protein
MDIFIGIGFLVVLGVVLKYLPKAIRETGVKRVHFGVEFHENEKPPKRLNH